MRAEPLPIGGVLGKHRLRVEWWHVVELLQDRILDLAQDEAELLLQEARLQQITGAEADAPDFVGIGGPDATPGRAQAIIAALLLLQLVEDRVPRHDQVGAVGDDKPVDADAARADLLHLFEQHSRIEHHAVADDAGRVGIENSGGNQVKPKFLAGIDDGVTGIVAALGADDHAGVLREEVDDLALPLVAPLASYEDRDHALAPACPVEVGELRLLIDEEQLEFSGRSIAVLGDDDLGDVAPVLGDVVVVKTLAINEEDEVRVLLDAATFSQVRKLRTVINPFLRLATQLRAGDDRNLQLASQALQRTRYLRNLLDTVLLITTLHQLEVIHDD